MMLMPFSGSLPMALWMCFKGPVETELLQEMIKYEVLLLRAVLQTSFSQE